MLARVTFMEYFLIIIILLTLTIILVLNSYGHV